MKKIKSLITIFIALHQIVIIASDKKSNFVKKSNAVEITSIFNNNGNLFSQTINSFPKRGYDSKSVDDLKKVTKNQQDMDNNRLDRLSNWLLF